MYNNKIIVKNIIFDKTKGQLGYWFAQIQPTGIWINLMSEEKRLLSRSSSVLSLSKTSVNFPKGHTLFTVISTIDFIGDVKQNGLFCCTEKEIIKLYKSLL